MNKQFSVVVDADAIVAGAYTRDLNHDKATRITQKLAKKEARFLYPVTSIAEAITVLQRKLNNRRLASMTAKFFTNRGYS